MTAKSAAFLAAIMAVSAIAGCSPVARDTIVLVPESDGTAGEVSVGREGVDEATTLNEPFTQARVGGAGADARVSEVSEEEVLARYGDLLATLPEPPVSFTVYFGEDAAMTPAGEAQLVAIEQALTNRPLPIIEIVGHTDTLGSRADNQDLSRRRAEAVRDGLPSAIADDGEIRMTWRGEEELAISTEDGVYETGNRRAEVTVRSGLGELNRGSSSGPRR